MSSTHPGHVAPLMQYADPTRCPACRTTLLPGTSRCRQCGADLRSAAATQVFEACRQVDTLVSRLMAASAPASAQPAPATMPAPAAGPAPAVPWDPAPGAPAAEASAAPAWVPSPGLTTPPARGMRMPSVPVILLGLGALCLLVASLIFLAFAWSFLGVGGRTAVLVLLTALAGASAGWLGRRQLPIACEALLVVALGLLTLDLAGANSAGWLGDLSAAQFTSLAALVLVAVSLAGTEAMRLLAGRRTVGTQVIAGLAALAVPAAGIDSSHKVVWVALFVGAALAGGWALLRAGQRVSGVGLLVAAGAYWLVLAALGVPRAVDATYAEAFDGFANWPLLAAAALVAAPAAALWRKPALAALFLGFGGAVATLWATGPALFAGPDDFGIAGVVSLACWLLVLALTPRALFAAPAIAGLGPALGAALTTAMVGFGVYDGWEQLGERGQPWDYTVKSSQWMLPWLALPATILLVGVVLVAVWRLGRSIDLGALSLAVVPVAVVGGIVLAAYGHPVVYGVALVLLGVLAAAVAAWRWDGEGRALAAGAVGLAAGLVALMPAARSDGLVLVTTGLLALVAAAGHLASRERLVAWGCGLVAPMFATAAMLAALRLLDVPAAWQAVPVLLALAAVILLRPRVDLEIGAGVSALAAAVVTLAAVDRVATPLAIDLTLAGAALAASAVLHPSRRLLAVPGWLLLAAATWVRLADLGVNEPEAYTLPSALALLGFGVWRLRRHPQARTWSSLSAGLTLATVPSLLWVMVDPGPSLRALLLAAACLGLVLGGTALRWSAPLVIGAAVGAVTLLWVIGPYAANVPPWVLIGLGGALLVGLGVTWESRLREVRHSWQYLNRLR